MGSQESAFLGTPGAQIVSLFRSDGLDFSRKVADLGFLMAPGWIGRSGRARRWAGNRVYEGGGVRCNSWVVFAPWKVSAING